MQLKYTLCLIDFPYDIKFRTVTLLSSCPTFRIEAHVGVDNRDLWTVRLVSMPYFVLVFVRNSFINMLFTQKSTAYHLWLTCYSSYANAYPKMIETTVLTNANLKTYKVSTGCNRVLCWYQLHHHDYHHHCLTYSIRCDRWRMFLRMSSTVTRTHLTPTL